MSPISGLLKLKGVRWLLLVFVVVFLLGHFAYLRPAINQWLVITSVAESGTLAELTPGWGIVLGREQVYYSQNAGRVIQLVSEGQRVRANTVICEIVDDSRRAAFELRQRASSLSNQEKLLRQRVIRLEETLLAMEDSLRDALLQEDVEQIQSIEESLAALQTELSTVRSELLAKTSEGLIDIELRELSQLVRSPAAGIVRFSGDGYAELELQEIQGLWQEDIEKRQQSLWQVSDGQLVGIGVPLFRLDLGHELLGYFIFDSEIDVQIGAEITLKVSELDDQYFTAKVENVLNGNEDTALTVRFTRYDQRLLQWRSGTVELVQHVYSGLIVPKSSLVERNGTVGVYLQSGEELMFSVVRKIGEVGDQIAVSGIPVGARVVTNPKLVYYPYAGRN